MPSSTPHKPLLQLAEKKCSSRADGRARDMRAGSCVTDEDTTPKEDLFLLEGDYFDNNLLQVVFNAVTDASHCFALLNAR